MKKLLSIFVALAVVCSLITPQSAFAKADQKIKLEEAINTAKKMLDIKTENYNFNYNYNENNDGISSYELSWASKKPNGGSIQVTVNSETNEIIGFYQWDGQQGAPSSKIPKYSKDNAMKAAEEFIKKLAKDKFSQTVLKEQPQNVYDKPMYSDSYNFNFVRKVNGLEFQENGFYINIDKNTLRVRSYNMNWDNAAFTEPSKAISLDAAKKVFADKLGIELTYYMIYDYQKRTQTPILVYTYANGTNPIDAVTGEVISYGFYPRYANDAALEKSAMGGGTLTPEEQKSIDASDKYVTKDAAIAEAKKYLTIEDTMKLTYSNLSINLYDGSASWFFNWNKNDATGKYYSFLSASVDATTGKIKSFTMNGNEFYPEKETNVSYTKDQAKKLADDFINSLEPEKFKQVVYKDDKYQITPPEKVSDYSFRYVAKINGATASFDYFNVTINAYSGKIMSYGMDWKNITLPTTDNAMNLEKAYKNLYEKAAMNLRYIKFYNYSADGAQSFNIRLAYVLDDFSGFFDANTGTMLDYSGKPVKQKKVVSFTDIKGNPAENDINLLIDLGIIDTEAGTFEPSKAILQKDFIKLLAKTLEPSYSVYDSSTEDTEDAYDAYYQIAIQRNIIKESQIKQNATVTKLDATKFIIRAMGLGYVAENGSMFTLKFKDAAKIPSSYKGYVALAAGLNIIQNDTSNFDGSKQIAKGQTATMLVNYLKVDTNK